MNMKNMAGISVGALVEWCDPKRPDLDDFGIVTFIHAGGRMHVIWSNEPEKSGPHGPGCSSLQLVQNLSTSKSND